MKTYSYICLDQVWKHQKPLWQCFSDVSQKRNWESCKLWKRWAYWSYIYPNKTYHGFWLWSLIVHSYTYKKNSARWERRRKKLTVGFNSKCRQTLSRLLVSFGISHCTRDIREFTNNSPVVKLIYFFHGQFSSVCGYLDLLELGQIFCKDHYFSN